MKANVSAKWIEYCYNLFLCLYIADCAKNATQLGSKPICRDKGNLNNSKPETDQGCQIFLVTIYQNGGKYTDLPQHYLMAKIYQMTVKYCK
jgi:hypothetical protein